MTQHLFNSDSTGTGSDKAVLDANFTELYTRTTSQQFAGTTTSFGKAPANWGAAGAGSGIDTSGSNIAGGGGLTVASNCYYNGGWKYTAAGAAARYDQVAGAYHAWYLAPAGTADATVTFLPVLTLATDGALGPGADNTQKLGVASGRWSTVYAGTGTINTSDAREKTAVTPLTASEIAASQELVSQIGTYQWLEAIQAKGEGDARKHIGMTVQQAISVLTSHGLDPMAYGFICYDSWQEQRDADGKVTLAAGDRYSFRPDELGMFIARGVAAALAALDARLTAHGL